MAYGTGLYSGVTANPHPAFGTPLPRAEEGEGGEGGRCTERWLPRLAVTISAHEILALHGFDSCDVQDQSSHHSQWSHQLIFCVSICLMNTGEEISYRVLAFSFLLDVKEFIGV